MFLSGCQEQQRNEESGPMVKVYGGRFVVPKNPDRRFRSVYLLGDSGTICQYRVFVKSTLVYIPTRN
jgi:hypothetical protein